MRHLFVAALMLQMQCKRKAMPPPIERPPAPLTAGKCHNVIAEFRGNDAWVGETVCDYGGYRWSCPTGTPESSRICKRGDVLPPEQAK